MQIRVKVSVCLFYFTYWLSGVFGSILVHHAVLYRSFTFGVCVIRHFRLSLLNNFYCDILHLYNIVIPTQVQYNICKPEEGWLWPAEILPVMKKQYILF